jgi:hypothetical protein
MTNILSFQARSPRQNEAQRFAALTQTFASERRSLEDVFWMKEVAELLNILECTGHALSAEALAPLEAFYESLENRMGFFPQYYRFLLSIAADLEALGLPGTKAAMLTEWAVRQGLPEAEISDLQRAEARRLVRRSGQTASDPGLNDRLRAFTARSATFALPNKKAAYELTHTVFYLSEYGRVAPDLPPEAVTSLQFAGTLAYLDQNADLLAECCIALRHAGQVPPAIWEEWIREELRLYTLTAEAGASLADEYHEYFVCNWALATAGDSLFAQPIPEGRVSFRAATGRLPVLREMSQQLFAIEGARAADWSKMRGRLTASLSDASQEVLATAEAALPGFEAFFEGFARASQPGMAV